MKKFVFLALVVLATAAAAWYLLRPGDKARDLLPADATAVAVFQPAELFQALGLTSDEIKKMTAGLGDLAEAIDLTEPAYAFVSENGLAGVAINVNDAEKLLSAASDFGFASTAGHGYQWIANSYSIGLSDGDKLLLCGPASAGEQDALRSEMLRLMKQSRQDVPMLDRTDRQKGFLRLSSTLGSLPKEYVPKGFDISDAYLNASLAVGDKDMTLSMNVEDADGKPYAAWPEGEELLKPIDGRLPIVVPDDDPFAWLRLGVKGDRLLSILRSGPRVSVMLMALNVVFFDVDQMLKAIDGDVAIVMPKADILRREALLTAHISNSDFLKDAEELDMSTQNGMSLHRRGAADDYVFTFRGERFYFGVRGETLYIATSERLADQFVQQEARGKELPPALGQSEKGARGKYLSGSVDLGQLVRSYASVALMLGAAPQVYEAIDALDRLNIESEAPMSFKLSLTTKKPLGEIIKNEE